MPLKHDPKAAGVRSACLRAVRIMLVVLLASVSGCQTHRITTRTITLHDSAALRPDAAAHVLTIKQSADGEPLEYAMDVRSVYCLDTTCEIISVRLFWDALGVYRRYTLPAGKNLTRDDHAAFSREDHRTLHRLLGDSDSQLKLVDPQELFEAAEARRAGRDATVDPGWRNPEYRVAEADAVSTPTPPDLKSLVVPGAAYTSLTLWNWAHGEAPTHIRRITRDMASRRQLLRWLDDADPQRVRFALEALAHRRMFDPATLAIVLERCRRGDGDWVRPAWNYLTGATPDRPSRLSIYTTLMKESTGPQRLFLLAQLADEQTLPEAWNAALASFLGNAEGYYEVHLLLSLLEDRKVRDPIVIQAAIDRLEDPDAFIARRIEQFLDSLRVNP
jgi:hypothetical protein